MAVKSENQSNVKAETLFLPDFCGIRMGLMVVIVAELLAFVILLATTYSQALSWDKLGVISLFVQWIAMGSVSMICLLRKRLASLSARHAGYASYLIILLVTLIVSEIVYWALSYVGMRSDVSGHGDFLIRNMGISAILGAITLRFLYLQHQQKLFLQAHSNARIQALQARIRPHFLFNSMNTIAALIRAQPDNAEMAVEDLSDLFRASLNDSAQFVSIAEEVATAKRYIHIEQLRLGERLTVQWKLEEIPDDALLPVLTLQPLLENAIYHGIEKIPDGGEIQVLSSREDNWLGISIMNPCIPKEQAGESQGNQMATGNINERLRIAFGDKAGISINRQQSYCMLEIKFPYRTRMELE